MCYLELQDKSREALVSGYAVWPDVFARIFLGMHPGSASISVGQMHLGCLLEVPHFLICSLQRAPNASLHCRVPLL